MDPQTGGFDVAYEIDHDSVLEAMIKLVRDPIAMRIASLDLYVPLAPAPPNTVQHGTLRMLSQPTATLDLPATNPDDPTLAGLTIRFSETLLQLDAVPTAIGFGGVGALPPTAAGDLSVAFRIAFSAPPSLGGVSLIVTPAAAPSISNLGNPPNLQLLSATIDLAPLLEGAVQRAVSNALATLFPLQFDIPFGSPGLCNIGLRSIATKILPAGSATKAALGFFLNLLETSQGDLSSITQSTLTTAPNVAGAIVLSNAFLKELVCCLFRQSPDVTGLPEPNGPDTNDERGNCCHWKGIDNVVLATQRMRIEQLDICVVPHVGAQSTLHLYVKASQSGTGWTAYASVDVDFQLIGKDGTISVNELEPVVKTWQDISPWVWVIVGLAAAIGALAGAVIGFFVAGWAGAGALAWKGGVIGAAVGIALVGVTEFVLYGIGSVASQAISGVLGALGAGNLKLLPDPITQNFGTIGDIDVVDFDALFVGGRVRPADRGNVVSEGSDVVLGLGDEIDLDRGVIQRAGETAVGFGLEADLLWRADPLIATSTVARMARFVPAPGAFAYTGTIASSGAARLVPIGGSSFWSLTETALETIAFPTTRVEIASASIAQADMPYPSNARVFAVRTSEGHLAKCVAWRDSTERLHLSFVTYNTPVPLAISSRWTVTRGPAVAATPFVGTYQVARTGQFAAVTRGIAGGGWWPVPPPLMTYRWLWNDQPLTGSGTLPDGTTTYAVFEDQFRLQTAMGTTLSGVLQLVLETVGKTYTTTIDIAEPGTIRVPLVSVVGTASGTSPVPPASHPVPIPPAVIEQLPAAFARGMGIPIEDVKFR